MNGLEAAGVIAISSALIGAVTSLTTTWLSNATQRRAQSGSVQTADAQTLFQASNQLIQMLLTTTQQLSERLDRLTEHLGTMMDRVERLVAQQDELLRLQREQTKTLHNIEANGASGKE
ncbi:MAG: hypothetical protein KatS3mg051_1819 [Anaerolineae bacterium]|nr:MAG: hypothetical protein KatS3mg051_1819 [Anaerolineae bacterium]